MIAKSSPNTVRKIAEMMSQLLVQPDAIELELNAVKQTLNSLFHINAGETFLALFALPAAVDINLVKAVFEYTTTQLKQQTPVLKKDPNLSAIVSGGLKMMLTSANTHIGRDELKFFLQALIGLSVHGNNSAKIKADESFKSELGNIVTIQAGIRKAANSQPILNWKNENDLQQFLAAQGAVANLANVYGVDAAIFIEIYFTQLLPNLELIPNAELKNQVLHAIASGSSSITAKQAQQFYSQMWNVFKQHLPTGEVIATVAPATAAAGAVPVAAAAASSSSSAAAASSSSSSPPPKLNYAAAEVALFLFHVFAPLAPSQLKATTGIFTPTGQPGEELTTVSPLRDEFLNRIAFMRQNNSSFKTSLHQVERTILEEIKQIERKILDAKKAAMIATKAAAQAAKASAVGGAGQPVAASSSAAPAAASASAIPVPIVANVEADNAALVTLRSKLQSVKSAVRVSANIHHLCQPLLHTPLPTFLPASSIKLSWKVSKVAPEGQQKQGGGGGGVGAAGKGQHVKGQKRKSGQLSGSSSSAAAASSSSGQGRQQKPHQQGNNKSNSNKKRNAGGQQISGGNGQQSSKKKKQRRDDGGNSQQQNGGGGNRSNKKQRRSQSNKSQNGGAGGGQQQRQGGGGGGGNRQKRRR